MFILLKIIYNLNIKTKTLILVEICENDDGNLSSADLKVSMLPEILYSFFSFTVYSNMCTWVLVCLCSCVSLCICRHTVLLWLQVFKASFLQDALFCRKHDDIDVCWDKWTDVLTQYIGLNAPSTQKKKSKKHSLHLYFFLSCILTHKLVNVHIKLNHYILLNTFLWCLLNDRLFPLLSEKWEHYMSYIELTRSSYVWN